MIEKDINTIEKDCVSSVAAVFFSPLRWIKQLLSQSAPCTVLFKIKFAGVDIYDRQLSFSIFFPVPVCVVYRITKTDKDTMLVIR